MQLKSQRPPETFLQMSDENLYAAVLMLTCRSSESATRNEKGGAASRTASPEIPRSSREMEVSCSMVPWFPMPAELAQE